MPSGLAEENLKGPRNLEHVSHETTKLFTREIFIGENEMRITRKTYEKARAAVEAAREQLKLVKAWEDANRRIGDLGNHQLVAITVSDDGSIRTECELVAGQASRATSENNLG